MGTTSNVCAGLARQGRVGWGAKVIERLEQDLRSAFPDMMIFTRANLMNMLALADDWPDAEIVQQGVGQTPGGRNLVLLTKLKSLEQCLAYALRAIEKDWSRNVLAIQIERRLLEREGQAVANLLLDALAHHLTIEHAPQMQMQMQRKPQ